MLLLVDLFIVAPLSAWLANEKGRSPTIWFVVAAIAGPIALVALGLGPAQWESREAIRQSRRCPECDTRVSIAATRCPACRTELPSPPATEHEPEPVADTEPAPEVSQPPEVATIAEPGPVIVMHATRHSEQPGHSSEPSHALAVAPRRTNGLRNIATGVFAGGSAEMVVGYRYMISLTARQLQIAGPVDLSPQRVVFKAARESVEAAALRSDLVIGAETTSGQQVQLSFRGVSGGQGDHLVAILDEVRSPKIARPAKLSKTAAAVPVGPGRQARRRSG